MSRVPYAEIQPIAERRRVGPGKTDFCWSRFLSPVGFTRTPLAWHPQDLKTRVLFWGLLAVCVLTAAGAYTGIIVSLITRGAAFANAVFLFWGWSAFIHAVSPASLIYHQHRLFAFEQGLTGTPSINLPFAYPPFLLLLIWPLALLSPVAALLVWLATSLVLYLAACWHRSWGPLIAMLALVAPSTIATCGAGQISLFCAALMIGGCRLIGRRPVLAGVMFGLLAVKPQLGVMVPIALVASREWRSFAAASMTVFVSILVSGVAFGWATWTQLPHALLGLSHVAGQYHTFDRLSPTVTSGLRMLGVSPAWAKAAQGGVGIGAAVAIWVVFRRGFTALPAAALMVGAFLVTPYAWYVDLPMVSYAALIFVRDRYMSRGAFTTAEIFALVLVVFLPELMAPNLPAAFQNMEVPCGMIVIVSFFVLILRRIAATSRLPAPAAY